MAERTTTINAALAGTIDLGGDLTVNRFGFGAMRITGEGIWGEPQDREECKRALRRTLELGINLIDTADAYGPEVSERLIAETLHPYPDDLVIATKGGLTRPGPARWNPDGRPVHLRAACEGSLKRLRVDQIDVYQFHRAAVGVPACGARTGQSSLGRDHQVVRIRVEGLGDQPFADLRTIGVGCIDQVDTELEGPAQDALALLAILRFSPDALTGDPHGAKAKAIHRQIASKIDRSRKRGVDGGGPLCHGILLDGGRLFPDCYPKG